MENMTLKTVIVKRMQDILSDVKWANHLVEEGKDVPADRKLQGIRTKILALMDITHRNLPDDLEFAQTETMEITEEITENVAQTTAENQLK